jgi:anti-sigma B factor antagonist
MERTVRSRLADDGSAIVAVLGEIDFTNADEVSRGIEDAVSRWSPPAVRVDLRGATFIDSTGLGALIVGYRAATASRSRFVVMNPGTSFRRVLAVTGLCELFSLDQDTSADEHPGIAI